MRRLRNLLRLLGIVAAALVGLAILGSGLLAIEVSSRKPLKTVPSTIHVSLARQACIDCHAPIAEEWRQSFHYRSLTGPYWKDVREMGYLRVFEATRKACINCHAPANVLDLEETVPAVIRPRRTRRSRIGGFKSRRSSPTLFAARVIALRSRPGRERSSRLRASPASIATCPQRTPPRSPRARSTRGEVTGFWETRIQPCSRRP